MDKEKVKAIVTGKVKVPKIFAGFVPGEKFKTQAEVEKAIEREVEGKGEGKGEGEEK